MAGTRTSRLLIVGACLVALMAMVFISIEPQTQYTVDEVMSSPDSHEGDIHLRGQVTIGSVDTSTTSFELMGQTHSLSVSYSGAIVPDGFDEGNTIAVKGNLVQHSGEWVLEANEIQTGCPSKYSE